jgi:hypothetical protein
MANPSLHAALHNSTPSKTPVPLTAESPETKKLIVEIPAAAHYQIDKMRLELRRESMKALVTEALNDLFIKHGYPPIAS